MLERDTVNMKSITKQARYDLLYALKENVPSSAVQTLKFSTITPTQTVHSLYYPPKN